jgi:molybdenum cofactor cytidylyltransferase
MAEVLLRGDPVRQSAYRWDPQRDAIVRSDHLTAAVLAMSTSTPSAVADATVEACLSSVDRVAVVIGADIDRFAPALARLPIAIESNPGWAEGIASAIRRAVAWASRQRADALMLVLADPSRPITAAAHLDRLIGAFRSAHRAVASRYAGDLAMPAVFDRSEYPSLLALDGDRGASPVVLRTSAPVIVDMA